MRADSRQYPERPIVGVGGVIVMDDGRVVLIKRKFEPAAGTWTLPGETQIGGRVCSCGKLGSSERLRHTDREFSTTADPSPYLWKTTLPC